MVLVIQALILFIHALCWFQHFFVPYAPWQVSQNVPSMNKSLKCQHTCRLISLTCLQGSAGLFPALQQELTGLILNLFLPHSPRQPVRRGLCENGSVHRSAPRLVNRAQSWSYRATTSQQSNDWESGQSRSWGDSEAWLIAPCWDPERKSSSMFVWTLRTYSLLFICLNTAFVPYLPGEHDGWSHKYINITRLRTDESDDRSQLMSVLCVF